MAKFATFKDMFKWNKNLMEDDFNEGQLYTVKHKAKLGSFGDLETNVKVGEAASGSHKLSADHKVSGDVSDMGGVKWEFKGKQDGSVEYKEEFRFLQVSHMILKIYSYFFSFSQLRDLKMSSFITTEQSMPKKASSQNSVLIGRMINSRLSNKFHGPRSLFSNLRIPGLLAPTSRLERKWSAIDPRRITNLSWLWLVISTNKCNMDLSLNSNTKTTNSVDITALFISTSNPDQTLPVLPSHTTLQAKSTLAISV